MGTKPDNLESRRKKLQTENKVADENPKSKISDALAGTFFDLQGSEAKGYIWTCPMCKASNTKSKNISQHKGTLSFKCTGCKHEFDIAAAEESDPLASDELDTTHWGITLTEGVPEFRLGNWTTDGWYWDGGPEMILMFLARMMDDLPSLLGHLKQRPVIFSALVSEFEKAKSNQEALTHLGYVLTGDNQVWHFGGVEDLLSQDFDRDLEFFDQGFNESIREQILADPAFTWGESLSDEQLEEVCVSEALKLRWTPSEEEKDQICLEATNDFIKGQYLDMRNLSAFVASLIAFPDTDFEETRQEIWKEWGDKILDPQWNTYIANVKTGLLKYKEEGDETPPPVDPNHPKLPFEASKAVTKSIPTRTAHIDGTPNSEKPPRAVTKASRTVRKKAQVSDASSSFALQEDKPRTASDYDVVGQMMAYEQGDLGEDETITLFQHLIDSGLAWQLQGHYGRSAKAYLDAGLCHLPGEKSGQAEEYPDLTKEEADRRQSLLTRKPGRREDELAHELGKLNRKKQLHDEPWSRPGYKASKRKSDKWTPPSKEAIAGKLLSVCRDILENGEHHFSENNGWHPTLSVTMYQHLKNAVTDAIAAGIGGRAPQASEKESGSVSLVPVSRTSYSAYIRTLDGVQEVPVETSEGHSTTILKGSKAVARAFYPTQGEPSYHISSDPQSFGEYLSLSNEEKMDLWKHRPTEDGEPDRYLNYYRCPNDNTEWEDASPYTNNDRCPTCNQEIEPYKSEDI